MSGEKKTLLLKKLDQPRGSYADCSFTFGPSGMLWGAGVAGFEKMQCKKKKKNKHGLETLGGDYSYCNAGF